MKWTTKSISKKKWMSFNCQVGHKKLAEIRDEGQWREERLSRYAVRVNEEKKNLQITMSNINGDIKHNNKGISNKETNLLCCEVKVIVSRVTHVLCSERMHRFWNMELHGHNWVENPPHFNCWWLVSFERYLVIVHLENECFGEDVEVRKIYLTSMILKLVSQSSFINLMNCRVCCNELTSTAWDNYI